jgi:hypothetical protein
VHDAKLVGFPPRRVPDRETHRRKHVLTAERPKCRTERYMHGMRAAVLRPGAMRYRVPRADELPACSLARTTPGTRKR